MIKSRKIKELSEILAFNSFYFHANDKCFCCGGLFVIPQDISPGIYKVLPLSKLVECEEERQRAIQGGREVVETASDKMSMAPELNPGD